MTCAEAREWLLVAEPQELRAQASHADGAIAEHLRDCTACSAIARDVMKSHDELHDALQVLTDRGATKTQVRLRTRTRLNRRSLAAAAVVAGVLAGGIGVQRHIARVAGEDYPLFIPAPPSITVPHVNAEGDGAVAVIRTANPDITVVWYLAPQRGRI